MKIAIYFGKKTEYYALVNSSITIVTIIDKQFELKTVILIIRSPKPENVTSSIHFNYIIMNNTNFQIKEKKK